MKKAISIVVLLTVLLSSYAKQPRYEDNFESLKQYEIPAWFADAKFGIFIHWGPYAVPEFGSEWYPRFMYMRDEVPSPTGENPKAGPSWVYEHHVKTYGTLDKFGYKDFIPMFKGENFDAQEWINLFDKAGAKYVVPVAEHHDAFAMYDSKHTRWNSVDMGPKRDVLGELFEAGKAKGLKMGASSHYAFNWSYFTKVEGSDAADPQYQDLYGPNTGEQYGPKSEEFKQMWWDRTTDIIDSYKPDILWFDFYFDLPDMNDMHAPLAAYYYNKGEEWKKEVVLQDKNFSQESYPAGTFVHDIERGKLSETKKYPWQTDTSVGKNSWCYVKNWESRTAKSLVHDLIDIVSKNGNLLLNVGPKADGTIPQDQQEVLLEMGQWLNINGEAIYETRPWGENFGEGPTEVNTGHHSEGKNADFTQEDFRFTTNGKVLYAICLDVPSESTVVVKSVTTSAKKVKKVSMLGSDVSLEFSQDENGLTINLPENVEGQFAVSFKIK